MNDNPHINRTLKYMYSNLSFKLVYIRLLYYFKLWYKTLNNCEKTQKFLSSKDELDNYFYAFLDLSLKYYEDLSVSPYHFHRPQIRRIQISFLSTDGLRQLLFDSQHTLATDTLINLYFILQQSNREFATVIFNIATLISMTKVLSLNESSDFFVENPIEQNFIVIAAIRAAIRLYFPLAVKEEEIESTFKYIMNESVLDKRNENTLFKIMPTNFLSMCYFDDYKEHPIINRYYQWFTNEELINHQLIKNINTTNIIKNTRTTSHSEIDDTRQDTMKNSLYYLIHTKYNTYDLYNAKENFTYKFNEFIGQQRKGISKGRDHS